MPENAAYWVIAAICGVIILSYVFSLVSQKTRIPTVLMLLVLGMAFREIAVALDIHLELPMQMLQFVGVLGLIIILLEAGLDLSLSKQKAPIMKRALSSSLLILIATSAAIAVIIYFAFGNDIYRSIVYAVPLAVISSTIVASSIQYLSKDKREFLTYESALSDIFGILIFNILIASGGLTIAALALNLLSIAVALVASVFLSIGLVFLLMKINIEIKAFLIFAVLLLIYAVGHMWELPTLLAVLVFGLILNNWRNGRFRRFHKYLKPSAVETAAGTVKSVTVEMAFLVRTVFFVMFGYTIDFRELLSLHVIGIGLLITAAILGVRFAYMLLFSRKNILPEAFFSPRGLVSIVLFTSIPPALQLEGFSQGLLAFVVLASTLVMTVGSIFFTPKKARNPDSQSIIVPTSEVGNGEATPKQGKSGQGKPEQSSPEQEQVPQEE